MTGALPNLRHLSGIVEVKQQGTLSAAAERINLSQPALTQGLSAIESTLGVSLFFRRSAGLVPTEGGEIYIRRIERIGGS
jgi:DNA-binding transcriptional LysR family regulator